MIEKRMERTDLTIRDEYRRQVFHLAAERGEPEIFSQLLERACQKFLAQIVKCRKGNTALHLALREGSEATVRLLVKNGANVEAKDAGGLMAVERAKLKWTGEMIELLSKKATDRSTTKEMS